MSPIITVLGATGNQGGSVVQSFLQDGGYQVRALTRYVDGPKAQDLAKLGVEVVQADVNDKESLVAAFQGSHIIYAVTDFFGPFMTKTAKEAQALETEQGKNIAQAASEISTLQHFIWSTLPDTRSASDGSLVVPHFQSKADVDHYIRQHLAESLLPKTTFMLLTGYVDNFQWPPFMPVYSPTTDRYLFIQPQDKTAQVGLLGDAKVNTGPFVLAIAKNASLTQHGRSVLGTLGFKSSEDFMKTLAPSLSKPLIYTKVDLDTYEEILPKWGTEMGLMLKFFEQVPSEIGWGSSGMPGKQPLLAQDLGLHIGKELETWETAMERMNWKKRLDL